MNTTNETLAAAIQSAWRTDDASLIADGIGTLGRDAYLALVADWKAEYASIVADIRDARSKRKLKGEGNHWNWVRQARRPEARRMMAVRMAIKELGRRHWHSRKALAA